MKKLTLVLVLLVLSGKSVVWGKNLQARLNYATFYATGLGPYIETYLSVSGNSVVFSPVKNDKFQASIEVTLVFTMNNEIKHFDKYVLLSPEIDKPDNNAFNFLDQQRISLPNGKYKFELTIRDKNIAADPYVVTQDVSIDYHENIFSFSDVELLESYQQNTAETKLNKSGYDLIPLVNNFFPDNANSLKFYLEIYNASNVLNNDGYVLSYHIEEYENHRVLDAYSRIQRMQSKPVTAVIKEIDITNIPSGNYLLVIEGRNRNNELQASRELFFQRSKIQQLSESEADLSTLETGNTFVAAYTNKDTLAEYIRSLGPISGTQEQLFGDNQLGLADIKLMQQFFYNFWIKKNPQNPNQEWMKYKAEVDKVNATYTAINKKGYNTDRGRVYLQYGAPNSISKEYNEPTAYPYEIWHYYKLKSQTNKKFVFYNTALATNDFQLIHSDAIGEPYDNQWLLRISKRTEINNDIDRTNSRDSYGKHANELFNNPH